MAIIDDFSFGQSNKHYLEIKKVTDTAGKLGRVGAEIFGLWEEVKGETDRAIRYEWEVAGRRGVKWLEYRGRAVKGYITKVEVKEGEYGNTLYVEVTDDTGEVDILKMKTSSKYGLDLMKKLPNVDMSKEVILRPYAFTPQGEEHEVRGVSVTQDDVKIENYYYDPETGKSAHGYPEPDFDFQTAEKWQKEKYWSDVEKFLIEQVRNLKVSDFKPDAIAEANADNEMAYQEANGKTAEDLQAEKEVNPEDIPF